MEGPSRETEHEHQCLCDIVTVHANGGGGTWESHDRCAQSVFNPDQPMCDECEAAGHAELEQYERSRT